MKPQVETRFVGKNMDEETKISVKERIMIISNDIRVTKAGKNDFTKSGYFQPDDILKALNPLLQKHRMIAHFCLTFHKEKDMYEAKTQIWDFDSKDYMTYKLDIPLQELKGAGRAQSAGATMTYAKRYLLMNIFNLADNGADLDNPKNKPADKIDWEPKLKAAKNLKELQELWIKVPANDKKGLEELKNLLKDEFTPNDNQNKKS